MHQLIQRRLLGWPYEYQVRFGHLHIMYLLSTKPLQPALVRFYISVRFYRRTFPCQTSFIWVSDSISKKNIVKSSKLILTEGSSGIHHLRVHWIHRVSLVCVESCKWVQSDSCWTTISDKRGCCDTCVEEMYTFFYKQPHFRVEPRVAIKNPKMRLKVAMKFLSIFGIEAQGC